MKRTSLWQRITALLLAVLLVAGYVPVQQVNAAETPMATVDALSSNLNVGSNGTAGISITATEGFTLQWVAADPSVGRTQDGWWAGFKVIAPEGIDLTDAVYYWNYADGTSSARKFWNVKDSSDDSTTHWVEIWKLITPEALNEALQDGKKFTQLWSFDWNGDDTCEQTVSLTLDPTKVILKTGDVQNYPNYGTVSAITSGVSLNTTNPAMAELSLAETITLDYDEANPDINRTRSGWWIGVKVVAPQLDVEVLKTATYTRKETNEPDKARVFWENKDSKDDDQTHWIGLWAYVTPEKLTALKAGEMLTHSWEFNWDNNAGIDQVITIKLDPAKLILNKDGAQQYPCYGNVSVITGAEVITLTGSGTASALAEVQAPLKTLVWAPADTSIGRYADGWWIGLKVEAPAGFTEAQADQAKYIRGSGENWESWDNARPFSAYKDGPTHITIWAPITEKILADAINAGVEVLSWSWKFDWLNSGDETKMQVVTIQVDPTLVELTNKNGDTGFQFPADPLYGTVSGLTDGITVTENASANVSASNEGKTDVVLQWADTSEGRPTEGWWAGIRIDLPEALKGESFDPTGITLQTMGTAGTWSEAIEFKGAYEYDGTSQYLTLWGLINEDRWDTGSDLVYKMRIDWNKDGIYEQLVTLTVDPQNYILKKGDDQVRPHSIGFSVTNGKVNVYGEEYPATITVDYQGGELKYTITPNENYHIQSIQHGDTVLDAFNEADHGKSFTYTFTPDGDVEVTATIVPDQRSFTVVETGKGEIDGNEATTEFSSVDYGSSATYTISTAKGYMAYVNDEPVEDGTYTVKNITEDTVVTVKFCLVEYTITYHSPLGEVPAEETYTIETKERDLAQITGVTGAKFLGWTVGAATQNQGEKVITAISGSNDIANIELYAVFIVSASFTAQRDGMAILPDTWYDGNRATLEIYTEVKGEGIEYAYSCGEEEGKTPDKVDVSVSGAAEKTYVIDSVTVKDSETSYVYAVATNSFTLKLDDSKPTIAIREGESTLWETWVSMVIDQVTASSTEKEFTVETTDSGSDEVKVSYVFVPFEKAIAKDIDTSNIDEVLAALGCSWSDYTDKISTSEIKNGEYSAYALIVRATDAVGNTSYVDSNGLLFDTIAPEITVSYDSNVTQLGENNRFYSKNDVTVTIHIKDAHLRLPDAVAKAEDYKSYTINFNDQNVEPFESNKTEDGWELKATLTVSENNELKANLKVNATDATGNSAKEYTAELLLDKKAPEISIAYTPEADASGNIYTQEDIQVKVTFSDLYLSFVDESFVYGIQLKNGETEIEETLTWSTDDAGNPVASFTIDQAGTNTVTVTVEDECGNSATASSGNLIIDTTAPVIDVAYAYGNGNFKEAQSASDTTVDTMSESSFYSNEDIEVTVTLKDDYLDPAENQYTYSIQLDRGEMPKEITWKNDADGNPTASFTLDTETYSGVYTLTVTVKDEAGNETKYDSGKLILDKTAPTITTMTIQNAQSAAQKVLNFLTFGIFFNGEIEVVITVQDELSLNFNDKTYPDQVASAHMHIEGVENPVPGTAVAEKPGEFIFKLPDTVLEEDIEKVITFTATDAAGNTSEPVEASNAPYNHSSNTFLYEQKGAKVDFSVPNSYIVKNGEEEQCWLKESTEKIEITVKDELEGKDTSGIQSVEIKLNGEAITVSPDAAGYDFTSKKVTNVVFELNCKAIYNDLKVGANELTVSMVDHAGNSSKDSFTFYKDITCPEIDVDYTYQNAGTQKEETENRDAPIYSNGDIIATITITDAHLDDVNKDNAAEGFATVTLTSSTENKATLELVAGSEKWNEDHTQWTAQYKISSAEKTETVSQLSISVADETGNKATYGSNSLLIDRVVPVITVDYAYTNGNLEGNQTAQDISGSEAMKNFYANGDIQVKVTIKDDYLDFAGDNENKFFPEIQLNGTPAEYQPDWTAGANEWTATYTITPEQVNKLTVSVSDEAGNKTDYTSGKLVLDGKVPQITKIVIGKQNNSVLEDIANFLTFGIFFNEEVDVIVSVQDNLSIGFEEKFPAEQVSSVEMTMGGETQKLTEAEAEIDPETGIATFTFTLPGETLAENVATEASFTATDAAGNTCAAVQPSAYDKDYASNTFLYETTQAVVDFSANESDSVTFKNGSQLWMLKDQAFTFVVTDLMEGKNTSGIRSVIVTNNDERVLVSNTGGADSTNGKFYYTGENVEEVETYQESYSIAYGTLAEGVNEISVTVTDNAGNEVTETYTVYVDKTIPEIIKIAFAPTSKYEEGNHEAFNPVETEYGFYFSQETEVTITANDPTGNGKKDDISGVAAIHYILDDIDNENDQNVVVTSAELQDNAISFTIPANFKGQIYALALDNVNNFRQNQDGESEFVAPDGTIIANQARHDEVASVTIERAETAWKDHKDYDLYSGDVLLTMNAADTYAGLRTVEWYVELDGRKLADGKVEIDNSANMTGDTWTLVEQVSNLITKLSRTHNVTQEGNGFKAYLKLTDRIGHTSEVENVFSIDRTAPTCKVNYNTPAQTVGNTSYYNQPLVAEIEITELNFDPDDFVVTVNGTSTNVTWKSEGDKNVATLTLNADNTYVIGVTGQDMAKNAMEEYVSENHVVDQTAPVCNVTFSEESNPVGDISYHDEPLVATITIDELNFNENDFVVTVNGEATAVDWNSNGTVRTAILTFTEDGEYIIGVSGQDMARNAMEEYTSNTRIVDQNAPAVVTDLQHESANNEETIRFTITIADQNLPVENIKAELTRVIRTGNGFTAADFETETVTLDAPVEIEWDEGRPIAYTITVPNLDRDGYYTLTLTVTDHAGNVTTLINAANTPEGQDGFEAVNFSVNREGSVFWIETEHTDKYAEGALLKNELFGAYANDNVKVIIHEVNVDKVDMDKGKTSLNINDGSSTTDVTLVEGTNYAKNQESGLGGWFENIYTLDNSNFEKDGMYSLSLLTYDEAENSNINTKQTEEGAEPTGTIRFTVDRTNPVISTNVYQDQRINEPQYVVEFQIADANLDESSLVVLVNGEIVSGSALTSLGGNIYQFTITDGLNQTIEITAKDKAKNPSEPCLIENVTVSTNILVLWYANTPLFWGTVGGFVALAALIAWLLIAKKRKEEKAEAK